MHYAEQLSHFKKFKDQFYDPQGNKFNIYERKMERLKVPRTRDQYVKHPLTQILQPSIEDKKAVKDDRFITDKLNIQDIPGVQVATYGKQKRLEGRNYMNVTDIEKTTPA